MIINYLQRIDMDVDAVEESLTVIESSSNITKRLLIKDMKGNVKDRVFFEESLKIYIDLLKAEIAMIELQTSKNE